MSFGADCLIQKLNEAVVGAEDAYDYSQIAGSINTIDNAFCCVPTVNDLPTACDNEGRFIYVEDIKSFRYSDGFFWTKDACTVLGNVNTNGGLWSWGLNVCGILGNGTTICRCSPGTIAGDISNISWTSVSKGDRVAAGIKCDGTLWTWGANYYGALANGTTIARCSPGTTWGSYTTWKIISVGEGSYTVSSGIHRTAAIKCDGTLWTWGSNNQGQLGDGTTVNRCSPGTVAGGGTTWCKISHNHRSSFAIKTDGTLWSWGQNICGQLGDGTTVNRCSPGTVWGGSTTWCDISGSFGNILSVKCDGTLWTWGCNNCGILGDGTTIDRCSPGTVWGSYSTWCKVFNNSGFISFALKTDGTLWSWGRNNQGQLGDGTATNRCSPGTIAGGGTTWCAISAGSAIKTDGTLWTWGTGVNGLLGNGTIIARCSPGTTLLVKQWFSISNQTAIRTRGF